ncbi:MAG: BTAD domain-containing putative transcriptional regulator [Syntrophobacter sp.]
MIELIAKVPLFASLGRKEINFLAEIARNVEYPGDMVLFREGEIGDRLYIIVDGQLDIVKDFGKPEERLLRVCGPGEHVGEMCFLNPKGSRSATVRTRTTVRVLEIIKDDFEALLSRSPTVAFAIAQGITQRMLDSENNLIRVIAEKDRQLAQARDQGGEDALSGVPVLGEKQNSYNGLKGTGVPRLQIKTFGNFQVLRGETLIGENEWKAKQPKLLLKALIARGSVSVPKDVLIEDLWPEASAASGESNFKVVLHRLRKALEPSMTKAAGSSYLSLKENLLSLKKGLCQTDLNEFLVQRQKGRKAESAGDCKRAVQFYRVAVGLYLGDFLSEDLYAPWADLRRTELRAMYVELLFRMGDLYQQQGSSKKAIECYNSIIKADPACEEAYQKSMLIYSNRGMRSESLRLYEECKRVLENELGVAPGSTTVSIYKKIIDSK